VTARSGSLASELSDPDLAALPDLAAAFQRWISAFPQRSELRPDADVAQLASALFAAAEGGRLPAKAQRNVAPLEAALDAVIDPIASLTAFAP
jgi:hypothetical protein